MVQPTFNQMANLMNLYFWIGFSVVDFFPNGYGYIEKHINENGMEHSLRVWPAPFSIIHTRLTSQAPRIFPLPESLDSRGMNAMATTMHEKLLFSSFLHCYAYIAVNLCTSPPVIPTEIHWWKVWCEYCACVCVWRISQVLAYDKTFLNERLSFHEQGGFTIAAVVNLSHGVCTRDQQSVSRNCWKYENSIEFILRNIWWMFSQIFVIAHARPVTQHTLSKARIMWNHPYSTHMDSGQGWEYRWETFTKTCACLCASERFPPMYHCLLILSDAQACTTHAHKHYTKIATCCMNNVNALVCRTRKALILCRQRQSFVECLPHGDKILIRIIRWKLDENSMYLCMCCMYIKGTDK